MIFNSESGKLVIEELPVIEDIEGGSQLSNINYKLATIRNMMYYEVCKEHQRILSNIGTTVVFKVDNIECLISFTLVVNSNNSNYNGVITDYQIIK